MLVCMQFIDESSVPDVKDQMTSIPLKCEVAFKPLKASRMQRMKMVMSSVLQWVMAS